jgi:hypothetical protein
LTSLNFASPERIPNRWKFQLRKTASQKVSIEFMPNLISLGISLQQRDERNEEIGGDERNEEGV